MLRSLAFLLLAATVPWALAKEAAPAAVDPALEQRVMTLASELRCLVCQNQTIADSNAPLAEDLRNQVREKMRQGSSDSEILAYMVARYGDFVLYRPPFKLTTVLLWFGPLLLLAGGFAVLVRRVLRRRRQDRKCPPPSASAPPSFSRGEADAGDCVRRPRRCAHRRRAADRRATAPPLACGRDPRCRQHRGVPRSAARARIDLRAGTLAADQHEKHAG